MIWRLCNFHKKVTPGLNLILINRHSSLFHQYMYTTVECLWKYQRVVERLVWAELECWRSGSGYWVSTLTVPHTVRAEKVWAGGLSRVYLINTKNIFIILCLLFLIFSVPYDCFLFTIILQNAHSTSTNIKL